MPERERLLAFDFGLRRIGAAVSGELAFSGQPVKVVANAHHGPDWRAIDALVEEWRPERLLVGWPCHLHDGTAMAVAGHAKGFARQLRKRYLLPVEMVDERLSSVAADDYLERAEVPLRKRRLMRDSAAAVQILEAYYSQGDKS